MHPLTARELTKYLLDCRPMKNTLSGNEGRGFMKILVASDTDTVVGVHLIGPETAEIIQVSCKHRADLLVLSIGRYGMRCCQSFWHLASTWTPPWLDVCGVALCHQVGI